MCGTRTLYFVSIDTIIFASGSPSVCHSSSPMQVIAPTPITTCSCGRTVSGTDFCLVCEQNQEYAASLATDQQRAETSNVSTTPTETYESTSESNSLTFEEVQ